MARWWQIPQVFVRCWVDWGTDHSIRWNRIGRPFLRGYMARKKSEREILENFFECRRYSRAIESAQWLYRSEAKVQKTVWRTRSNHWDGNKPIPLGQQVKQRLDQQFEGLEEHDYRLEGRTGWRYYLLAERRIHLRHHTGNQAATGSQLGAGIRSANIILDWTVIILL